MRSKHDSKNLSNSGIQRGLKRKTILTDTSINLSLPDMGFWSMARAMHPINLERITDQIKCALPRTKLLKKREIFI